MSVHDTCGILNLHGIPGIIGGISSSIAAMLFNSNSFSAAALSRTFPAIASGRSFYAQAYNQIIYLIITLAMAIASGSIVGIFVRYISPLKEYYVDSVNWEVPELEIPYYFDTRGEMEHGGQNAGNMNLADLEKRVNELEARLIRKSEYII